MVDSWLLNMFPGRTLEELDQIDVNRLQRALLARRMEAVEGRRKLLLQGKIKGEAIDKDEWALIVEMDEWAKE